jgi:curved DNA-binding protein
MEFKEYYRILGIEPDADKPTIKKAYRLLARKYHPDVSTAANAEEQFKEVQEAYEVLGNEKRKSEYDQLRKYGRAGENFKPPPDWQGSRSGAQGFNNGGEYSDFFANIFGENHRGQRSARGAASHGDFFSAKGQDIETELQVSLESVLSEEARPIEFSLPKYSDNGQVEHIKKNLKVKIPKGVIDGERIRLKGQGGSGRGNGQAGDLYLKIRLAPHPLFDVTGHDLTITLPISPWEAALGGKVTAPTLNGKIVLSIAKGSQSGKKLRAKGKGLPTKAGSGDLYVILNVVMPENSNEDSDKLWEQLGKELNFNPRSKLGE